MKDEEYEKIYNFHQYNGILFHDESLLSCFSNEYYMIYDHYNALKNLNYVYIHLPANRIDISTNNDSFIYIDIER